ncbi:MAG: PQQ-dependent sugar dehydrogenase [Nitrospira sp.]|nr:PQQ-dependent sugar dehydrogenase [Nitrospira sp.]MDH4327419.1 PQQ-dependent sugar dehydrogenase [Nitrospira sp.]MDH5252842.1 PQQ-dependent sugar dehydrogenase [Nitrospira sp.]
MPTRVIAFLLLLLLAGVGLPGCGEGDGQEPLPPLPAATDLTVQLVTANLNSPVFMTAPPNDSNRLFVIEKQGLIRIFNVGNSSLATFLDLRHLVSTIGERGLLGMAFDAQYATNRQFYVFYTDQTGDIVIARYLRNAANANVADPAGTSLLTIEHSANTNHNGGMLAFGIDGCLYASVGDGGGSGDLNNNAQTLTSRLGKILRLNPYTGSACNIATNPFFFSNAPEIWSIGLRNPWRFSFDRVTNDLYIADVGQDAREEINVSPTPNAGRGLNYGWRLMEGFLCFNPSTNCNQGGLTLPVLDYPHLNNACSVTGGYVYRGSAAPALRGTYFYADFCAAFVRSFRYQNGQAISQFEWPFLSRGGITSFGEDAQGELYLMTQGGSLFKIVPN